MKINLEQHGNDHQPDQDRHRQIDLHDLHVADGLEWLRQKVTERDARDDAKRDPGSQVTFEESHSGTG